MKYLVVLGDGMADEPIDELNGQTILACADTPTMDRLAKKSEVGLCRTIPAGMTPGSDTANLAVLGYDPKRYYTGRSPLEALSIGVSLKETDIALRCNIVTVSDDDLPYEQKTIIDHSSGEISTQDAAVLLDAVKMELENDTFHFYTGTSYRHLTVWDRGKVCDLTPPHDILGKVIGNYLPEQPNLRQMMEKSYAVLNDHPINEARARRGVNKANSLWFWGAGTKPNLDPFEQKYGKRGAMISAVDLLKGIAVGAKMTNIDVPGATGTLDTNWDGKADAAVKALLTDGFDFVYIHMEAPDEMGHQGSVEKKLRAVECVDGVLKRVTEKLTAAGCDFRLLLMPDHPTPTAIRTHTADPVPYLLFDSTAAAKSGNANCYSEKAAAATGIVVKEGYTLMGKLLQET